LFEKGSEKEKKFSEIYSKHIEREVFHTLFLHSASTSIEQIKKSANSLFVKSDEFQAGIVKLATSITDSSGKKKFRLKEDKTIQSMYDPFYYI
jgi:outer membrane receptor for Fe3+-dicitrate